MDHRRAVLLAALGLLGCYVGPNVKHFPAAQGPEGVAVHLSVRARQGTSMSYMSGELLTVEDTALLVRETSRGLVRVPFRVIQEADFTKMGPVGLGGGRRPSPDRIERLRLVSRFPQGLSPDLLRRLLTVTQQSEVQAVAQ